MIEPMMATMLGFLTTDARRAAGRCWSGRCASRCDDTFNAITVDGECSTNDCVFALRQRRQRRRDRRGTLRRASLEALRASAASWRSASSAAARARPSCHGHRAPAPRIGRRRPAGRARRSPTRRWSRPPSTAAIRTGAAWSRPPAAPASPSSSTAPRSRSAPSCSSSDGLPHDDAAPEAAEYLKGDGHRASTSTSAPAAPPRHGLDVRPQRRVRADQRGVPDIDGPAVDDASATRCAHAQGLPVGPRPRRRPTSSAASRWRRR